MVYDVWCIVYDVWVIWGMGYMEYRVWCIWCMAVVRPVSCMSVVVDHTMHLTTSYNICSRDLFGIFCLSLQLTVGIEVIFIHWSSY